MILPSFASLCSSGVGVSENSEQSSFDAMRWGERGRCFPLSLWLCRPPWLCLRRGANVVVVARRRFVCLFCGRENHQKCERQNPPSSQGERGVTRRGAGGRKQAILRFLVHPEERGRGTRECARQGFVVIRAVRGRVECNQTSRESDPFVRLALGYGCTVSSQSSEFISKRLHHQRPSPHPAKLPDEPTSIPLVADDGGSNQPFPSCQTQLVLVSSHVTCAQWRF